jgi:hypothetical protein
MKLFLTFFVYFNTVILCEFFISCFQLKKILVMKKSLLSLISLLFFVGSAMAGAGNDGPLLTFEKEGINYGTVYVDEMPETKHDISFTNTGNQPLILSNVRACCGTRVTAWPSDPIMPGEKGTISIEFRLAARPQNISRTVTVTSNNTGSPTQIFRITGTVIERN